MGSSSRCKYAARMNLAGRLEATSLGDLLGQIARAQATGVLALMEANGRNHRIGVRAGAVTSVVSDSVQASLMDVLREEGRVSEDVLRRSMLRALSSNRLHGEVLVQEYQIAKVIVGDALRRQMQTRLAAVGRLRAAQVTFRVACAVPAYTLAEAPLRPPEYLAQLPRARDRAAVPEAGRPGARRGPGIRTVNALCTDRERALRVLGLDVDAPAESIKRAYRRVVRSTHPDLCANLSHAEQAARTAELRAATEAMRALCA